MTTQADHTDHTTISTVPMAGHDTTPPPRMVTIKEAAELCGVTRDKIRGRVERGKLRVVRNVDNVRLIPVAELERDGLLGPNMTPTAGSITGTMPYHAPVAGIAELASLVERLHHDSMVANERAVVAEQRALLEQKTTSTIERELLEVRSKLAVAEQQVKALEVQLSDVPVRRSWFGIKRRHK